MTRQMLMFLTIVQLVEVHCQSSAGISFPRQVSVFTLARHHAVL